MTEIKCGTGGSPPTELAGAVLVASNGSPVAMPANSLTKIPMSSVVHEANECDVLALSGGDVEVTADGHYSVTTQSRIVRNGAAITRIGAELRINSTAVAWDDMHAANTSSSVAVAGQSTTLRPGWTGWLSEGDRISLWGIAEGSAGQVEVDDMENQMTVVWLGANQDEETGGAWA